MEEYYLGPTTTYEDDSEDIQDIIEYTRPKAMDGFYNLTVVDVYDQASVIGKEFEKIIDVFGVAAVTDLMPKVIQILEQLEYLASKNEKDSCEVDDLQQEIQKLELEKADRAHERLKYEQDLVHVEERWRGEAGDMMAMMASLKEENRRLKTSINEQKIANDTSNSIKAPDEEEMQLLSKLKDTITTQRDQVKSLEKQLADRSLENDTIEKRIKKTNSELHQHSSVHQPQTMQGQIERMKKSNSELRRSSSVHHKQTMQGQIEGMKKSNSELRRHPKQTMQGQIERMKKSNSELRRRSSVHQKQARLMQQEKADLQAQIQDHEHQMQEVKVVLQRQESLERLRNSDEHTEGVLGTNDVLGLPGMLPLTPFSVADLMNTSMTTSMTTSIAESEAESMIEKIISDANDRDRPRFTMNELRDVLMERNELKTKLVEVEDTLEHLKSQSDDDLVAEGPINKEPDEKLYPERFSKKNSTIKKIFNSLFSSPYNRHSRTKSTKTTKTTPSRTKSPRNSNYIQ